MWRAFHYAIGDCTVAPSQMKKPNRRRLADNLITIIDLVRFATTRFVEAKLALGQGTSDPTDEALFLVCEALHLPLDRADSFLTARLTAPERQKILLLIEKRIRTRKPAAYLLRRAYLQQVPFYVDERVIVPRSYIGELLDEYFTDDVALIDPSRVRRVLDLCTGSGCLAILAARMFPKARIDAVDLSADALAVARRNVREHKLGKRIHLFLGDLFAPLQPASYDLIIGNPPYVDAEGMTALPAECRHEPAMALDGGDDGTAIIRRIIDQAPRWLAPKGGLLCEVGRCKPALEKAYPHTPFLWLDTEETEGEVFWLPGQ